MKKIAYIIPGYGESHKRPQNAEVYILGFSFGAIIAFLSESKTKPTAIILCSLSPCFKEDLPKFPKSWSRWWNKNWPNSEYSFNTLAPSIKTNILMVAGGKKGPEVDRKMRAVKRLIKKVH